MLSFITVDTSRRCDFPQQALCPSAFTSLRLDSSSVFAVAVVNSPSTCSPGGSLGLGRLCGSFSANEGIFPELRLGRRKTSSCAVRVVDQPQQNGKPGARRWVHSISQEWKRLLGWRAKFYTFFQCIHCRRVFYRQWSRARELDLHDELVQLEDDDPELKTAHTQSEYEWAIYDDRL